MAKKATRSSRQTARLEGYTYRRALAARDLIPAIGIGVAAGLVAFYVTRLFIQRTPLLPEEQRLGKHHAAGRATG